MAAGTLVTSGSSGSMPTGSGSERLRRAAIHGLNNDTQTLIEGVAGHIYTILSIVFKDNQNAAGTIAIKVGTGSNIYLLGSQAVAANGTFVWNDKLVMEEDDDLDVFNSVTSGLWYVSYIDQDWT